eukprot:TRINITY_DN10870_c0_g3_i2.p1 TRINITY_DN10870_c0_g3~~TRINITY_DN10870_c0_g3_i2.p1  ORF type:complete len:104 (+),score=11.18 TRINITY_DN10870_c0_g3_i2:652-963(+)
MFLRKKIVSLQQYSSKHLLYQLVQAYDLLPLPYPHKKFDQFNHSGSCQMPAAFPLIPCIPPLTDASLSDMISRRLIHFDSIWDVVQFTHPRLYEKKNLFYLTL